MESKALQQTASEELTLRKRGYKLITKIGEGSYANVYIAEYQPTVDAVPSKLACKVVDTKKCSRKFAVKFLPRELDILIKLSHPHIIHTHSIFQRKHKYYIFMRYAESGDLLDFILKYGAIVEPQARFWIRQISLAIQYIHKLQIAHRDLKCENVLVTANHNVKVCDFGFSRYIVDENQQSILSETFCGSLSYASPEILKGVRYDPLVADMWALGILIFTMLNKAIPFDDTHVPTLYKNQMDRKWKFRRIIVDKLSAEVKSLIRRLLEPDALKRIVIEDVLTNPWFEMDVRLRSLNIYEQSALSAAQREADEAISRIYHDKHSSQSKDAGGAGISVNSIKKVSESKQIDSQKSNSIKSTVNDSV